MKYWPLLILFFWAKIALSQRVEDVEQSTIEVDLLLDEARHSDSDAERESLATQSLNLARSLRYDGGIIRSSLFLGEICARTNRPETAMQHFLEAESKLNAVENPILSNTVDGALGDLFFQEKLFDQAQRYYTKIVARQRDNEKITEKLADACLYGGRVDSAEYYYKSLINKYKSENKNERLVQIYQKLASAYDQTGNAGKSLYYYLPIVDLVERFGNTQDRAVLYNNLGRQYASLRDFQKSLEYFKRAELQCVYIPCEYAEIMYANMGIALHNLGDSKSGLDYLEKARRILDARNDISALAPLEHLIATVYFSQNDLYNAIAHNDLSIVFAKKTKQRQTLANAFKTSADIYYQLYEFENAFDAYRDYLNVADSIRMDEQDKQQRVYQQRSLLAAAEGQIKFLIALQNFRDLELAQERYERDRLELLNKNLELETRRREDELIILQKQKEVDQSKLREQTLQALRVRQELFLTAKTLDTEKQERIIAELRQQEKIDSAQRLIQSSEMELLRRNNEFAQLELEGQSAFRQFAYGIGAMLSLILALLGIGWLLARRSGQRLRAQNKKIQQQNLEIAEERQKSESLLLNILPDEVATELKTKGYATPREYASATVLFTDFVNFTSLSMQLTPEKLVDELNACFQAFDEICEQHGLEKIKTIGDAFMCAGGLPVPNETHALDTVKAAIAMCHWLARRNQENPAALFKNMRIGIHTGPVVAGVIGKNKFAYDIWGDAVNLAARLEEYGEPNRINISQSTADAIKHMYKVVHRGSKSVHNKGMVDMYFVEF